MRLLLLNNNPAVSRLIKLSVDKVGYEMDEFEEYALVPLKSYDLIMVDNESYDEEELYTLCEHSGCGYTIYICQRGAQKPEFMNVSLEKPFLPTDFLTLLERVKNVIESQKPQESVAAPVMDEKIDIDSIEAFGMDDAAAEEMSSFDGLSLEDEEPLMALDSDSEEEESDTFAMPVFDLDAKEDEDLDATFMKPSEQDDEDEKLSLDEFDFDAITPSEDDASVEESVEEESSPCILDKDDINEVKQLLDESDEEEKNALLSFEEPHFEEMDEEEPALALEEDEEEEEDENLLDDILMSEEPTQSFVEEEIAEEPVEELLETQEEIIDDFQEEIEEKIEDERIEPSVLVSKDNSFENSIESLDDLSENAIKRAFGEEVEDEIFEEVATEKAEQVEVIRGEIESSIARSISGLAQSDILKEALKGMRINISITFDEKN